jgi:hypothetical protein
MTLESPADLADFADKLDDDDLGKLPASVLKKMVRALKAKRLADREADEAGDAKAEEEREKLSDLHEEKKGSSPKVPVRKDDLPEELEDEDKPKKKG